MGILDWLRKKKKRKDLDDSEPRFYIEGEDETQISKEQCEEKYDFVPEIEKGSKRIRKIKILGDKCYYCGLKLNIMNGFVCSYCGSSFCSEHRLPEKHKCVGSPKSPPKEGTVILRAPPKDWSKL